MASRRENDGSPHEKRGGIMKHFWYSKMAHEDIYKPRNEARCKQIREMYEKIQMLETYLRESPYYEEGDIPEDGGVVLNYCEMVGGNEVLYTECSEGETPYTTYTDLDYLGEGEYHHVEPIGDC